MLVARDSAALIRGQLRSMGTMLAVLLAAMAAGFRSWRLGLLGLLPNVLPCAVLYGGMALLGCRLSVAAAMVGTVMLGLIVDQSIHLLHRYRGARVEGRSRAGAVARALAVTGRPIAITSTVLATGFGIGMLGTLETTRVFGALTAATILLALAATLLVTPAAILWRRRSELQRTGIASTIGAATMAPAGSERVPGERAPPAEEPAAGTGSWCTERT